MTLVDWPTLALIAAFWVSLLALAFGHGHIPSVLVVLALAFLGGLYMSLQHEVIHGHPTGSATFNRLLVCAPLGMLQPFSRYRETHLIHHASDLTDPIGDPESYYVLPSTWQRAGRVRRWVLSANRTLAMRLTIGPFLAMWRMLSFDVRAAPKQRGIATAWLVHIAACGLVVVALIATGLPVWMYLLGFVYGGAALTALRSFVEHRAIADGPRSAIVHSSWFFGVLFLNNNLHYTHHQLPGAAWFRLPELTRTIDGDAAVADGAGVYPSYGAVMRRFFVRPFDQAVNPLSAKLEV